MLRTTIAAVAALAGITLIAAPAASADICAKHGPGHYITACAHGSGGPGPTFRWTDSNGKTHFDPAGDIPASRYPAAAPS